MSAHISRQLADEFLKAAVASRLDASNDDFVTASFAVFVLALSRQPAAKREETLRRIERHGALREALWMNTRESPVGPFGTRH
jgi:hypothetical protein